MFNNVQCLKWKWINDETSYHNGLILWDFYIFVTYTCDRRHHIVSLIIY